MKNKNAIIGRTSHTFLKLYIDMLIHKCDCSKDDICIIATDNSLTISELDGVMVIPFESVSNEDFIECKTITAISLSTHNSSYLSKIIDIGDVRDKLYIHLTDDEVDRWLKTKDKHGELIPTKSNSFDDDCKHVLNHVKNLIAPRDYFEPSLQYLTGRDDLNFIDARDAFKSLPTLLWDKFSDVYTIDETQTAPENRIMIGAKRGVFSLFEVIALIQNLKKENLLPKYKLLVFTYKKKKSFRVLIDIYLGYLRKIRRCNVDISYPTATNSITYNALVMSCSHLLLQRRGSMSTTRSYLSLGRGVVHVEVDSPNYIELSKAESIKVAGYSSMRDVAKNIANGNIDLDINRKQIEERFEYKFSLLKDIYN
ncbi:hypothetical protein BCU68_09315 [Vibrio sp. 10N.286.49.B3]|nr:hypothetical protein BCU68_09315 [Vibrio sp. 10N.286.49.B3]